MPPFDAEQHLRGLVGSTISTIAGQANRVLRVEDGVVYVLTNATDSPDGEPVSIAEVQAAADRLLAEGEVRIHPDEIGYRSAFIGAVLGTMEDVETRRRPARALLVSGVRGRNPPWETDELILALDLYLARGLLDDTDEEVIELSTTLNRLPLSRERAGDERFRNPNGVAMKLGNFARLDPSYSGAGLSRGGRREIEVWERYANDRGALHRLAQELRAIAAGAKPAPSPEPQEGEDEAAEGRIIFRRHRLRERDRRLVQRKKDAMRSADGTLRCEICGQDPCAKYGAVGEALIEVHHLLPMADAGRRTTRLDDLAVVCRNCHGAIHAGGVTRTVEDLRRVLEEQRAN